MDHNQAQVPPAPSQVLPAPNLVQAAPKQVQVPQNQTLDNKAQAHNQIAKKNYQWLFIIGDLSIPMI